MSECSCEQARTRSGEQGNCSGGACDFHVLPERCTGCGLCLPLCAYEALELVAGKAVIDSRCRACGACFTQCPERAIIYRPRAGSPYDELVVHVNREECIGCGLCVSLCPAEAIEMPEGRAEITTRCIRCGTCLYNCPQKAIVLIAGSLLRG